MVKPMQLTEREEELMRLFWLHGAMPIREALTYFPDPKPHFNTVSTFVHLLEDKGFLGHESIGRNHRYFPVISEEEFSRSTLKSVVNRYFNNSLHGAISALVSDEQLTDEEIEELVQMVKSGKK